MEILKKKSGLHHVKDLLEDEPLTVDVKINGLKVISAIPLDGVGVFSYRAHLSKNSPLQISSEESKKSVGSSGFFGISSPEEKKEI
jgi:hypothetical protein